MGSVSFAVEKGRRTRTAARQYLHDVLPEGCTIVSTEAVSEHGRGYVWSSTLYVAVHNRETAEVHAWVLLARRDTDPDGTPWVTVKAVHEDMGPGATDALSATFFARLTAPPNEYAAQWRDGCARRRVAKESARELVGKTIVFKHPLRYGRSARNATVQSTFTVRSLDRLVDAESDVVVNMAGLSWWNVAFTVAAAV